MAGEGGGHEAWSLQGDLSGGGETTGNSEDESGGPADGASAGIILRRCGFDSHHCLANTGGHHRGMVQIRKISFPTLLGEWWVLVCEATGQIMNTPMLADAYNLDPQQQAELYQLQRVCPEAIPGHDTSSDDDDDVQHHLVRLQPGTDAMLDHMQPQGSHYRGSCCADALRLCSDAFFMRSVISVWVDQCERSYHERIVDLSIPAKHSYIMEYRWARAREERLAYRNNCIQNIHHPRLRCVEYTARGQGRVGSPIEMQRPPPVARAIQRVYSTEEQRAILGSELWRHAVSLADSAAFGLPGSPTNRLVSTG